MQRQKKDIFDNITEEERAETVRQIEIYMETLDSINLDHLVNMTHDQKIQYYADKGIHIEMLPEIYEDHTSWRPLLTWHSHNKVCKDDAGCLPDFNKIANEAFMYAEYIIITQNR